MDPYDFTQLWGYPPPTESSYRGTLWDEENGGSKGSGFYYQPTFQEEKPYQEGFPPQLKVKSMLELAMEAFMGQTSRPYATPQSDPRSELELLVERFARGSEGNASTVEQPCYTPQELKSQLELLVERFTRDTEACSNVETTTPINSSFLQASDEILRNSERLGTIVEHACAQLAHNHFLPF
ncbi:unnamed protein product [Linum trigynum]|uniref:Uncharacterized protein n=1 Tax=Linum trigynum TaxID=586398 RepID=A0AAV2D694_9ROSI